MATVDKNFRIKNGLAVEGTTATVNGKDILTKDAGDSYIINLIGGTATSANTPNTVVKRDGNGDFAAGIITADIVGNVTGQVSDISNHTTADLAEDPNGPLYFTNQRAVSANTGLWDTIGSAATAEQNANTYTNNQLYPQGTQAFDSYGSASDALNDANTYTNNAIDALTTDDIEEGTQPGRLYFTDTRAQNAISAGTGLTKENQGTAIGIDRTTVDGWYDASGTAAALINDASVTTTNVWSAYKTSSEIGVAVSNLVDSAPALLDTLNELAAAIADNPNYATDMAANLAAKQNTLTAGSNIDITSDVISVTGLNTADVAEDASRLYFTDTRAKDAVSSALGDGIEYLNGSFDVQLGTGLEIDGNNAIQINRTAVDAWYDAAGDAAAAQTAAETAAQNALNDVLDGTTPFTDLNINDVAKQVAARTTSLGSVVVTAYQFNKNSFRSGKFLVKIDNGTHNEISEILVTLDSSDNVAITEYAIVGTNGSRGTITADVDATHCRIRVNPVNDSTITVSGTVFNA